ncbi:MAG TPA: helix-turn-helix transcriptional regulator [Kofleriaceae bacterium]
MFHAALTAGLLAAKDFVDVGAVVCTVLKQHHGMHQSAVMLQALDGTPIVCVDDVATMSDELRMVMMVEGWRHDPCLEAIRANHAPVGDEVISVDEFHDLAREFGYRGDKAHMLLLPILQTGQLLGTIRCGQLRPFTQQQRRDLTTLSGHVSVRLAQLGVTTVPDPWLENLTPRQREVAQLAARGHTNADIGVALEMSENTVKKHLKVIFDLLEVANRTELAARLSSGPQLRVPVGVTRRGDLWITRAPTGPGIWPSAGSEIPTQR